MSFCVNPRCLSPQNPNLAKFCHNCGSKLKLKERYRPIQPIGRGGFGRTFLAIDEDIPSQPYCVIKQLFIQNATNSILKKATELFYQEAVRLNELGTHSQIPTLFAHFEQNQHLYLVQELIDGKTLTQELQQKGTYTETQIWEFLQDILPILHYVHTHKVVHRDIKPCNIMRRRDNSKLVLIDFGVAKLLSNTGLIGTGTIIGSPQYMPPEQLRGKVFPASDLYSLGVTCLYLLTDTSPLEMYDSINDCWVWRDFLPPGKKISDSLYKILDKLTQNSLKQRYQSVDEVLQVFEPTKIIKTTPVKAKIAKDLISTTGIDYTKLQDLLKRKKWQEADQQTWDVLCQAVGKPLGCYFTNDDIKNLPCEDLNIIDQLWLKYSEQRFGFSIQMLIYQDVDQEYYPFCKRVGWAVHNPTNPDFMLQFNLQSPLGHLPSRRWIGGNNLWRNANVLAIKLTECGTI